MSRDERTTWLLSETDVARILCHLQCYSSRVSLESAIKPRASHNNLRLQPRYILHFKVTRLYDFQRTSHLKCKMRSSHSFSPTLSALNPEVSHDRLPALLNLVHTNLSIAPLIACTYRPCPSSPASYAYCSSRNSRKKVTLTDAHPQERHANHWTQDEDTYKAASAVPRH
jgi:hypothetical protein